MKRKIFFLQLVCLFLLTGTSLWAFNSSQLSPTIKNKLGILDLTNYNLENNKEIRLLGPWEFYANKLYSPAELAQQSPEPSYYVKIPDIWEKHSNNSEGFAGHGFATYHLKIKKNLSHQKLSLKINTISTASKIFVNGQLLEEVGKIGTTPATSKANFKPIVLTFDDSENIDIVIQVSNFQHRTGGIWDPIYFGTEKQIHNRLGRLFFGETFIIGCLIIILIFNFSLFFSRPSEKRSLYLAVLCLVFILRTLSMGQRLIIEILPLISWITRYRIEYISLYFAAPIFALYKHSVLKNEKKPYFYLFALFCAIISSIITIITPVNIFSKILNCLIIFSIFVFLLSVKDIIIAFHHKNSESRIFLIVVIIFLIGIVNDLLNYTNLCSTIIITSYLATLIFIIQTVIISKQFTKSIRKVENLSGQLSFSNRQLKELNSNLEEKIEDRTNELIKANNELKNINKTLLSANDELKNTYHIMSQDLKMALKIQTKTLPPLHPKFKNWDIAWIYSPMNIVSGDFLDFYNKNKELTGITLCDVSGHGVASGLITMTAKSVFQRHLQHSNNIPLNKKIEQANAELINELKSIDNYLTGIFLQFHGNKINYVNAAHTDLLLIRDHKISVPGQLKKDYRGFFLGMELMEEKYTINSFEIQENDMLLLYTDGLNESLDKNDEQFGTNKLLKSLEKLDPQQTANSSLTELMKDFYKHTENSQIMDDLTIILLKKSN